MNIFIEYLSRIRIFFIRGCITHVLVIVSASVTFGAMEVDLPGLLEAPATPKRQLGLKISDSGAEVGVDGVELPVESIPIARPITRFGVEAREKIENSGTEYIASRLESEMSLNLKATENSNKAGDENKRPNGKLLEIIQYVVLTLIIVMIPIGSTFLKHNGQP